MQVSYETLEYVRSRIEKLITVHAEDPKLIKDENVRPKEAEIKAVERCLSIGDFYFCHVSTPEALDMIYNSKSFAEVTPHHLLLSKGKVKFERVNPPLRSDQDRAELLRNLNKADVIASDHAPHTIEDKKEGAPGFPGVETMYPLMLNLVRCGVIDLKTLIERIVINPAKIFGFSRYSGIEVGNYANFAVFDFSNVKKIRTEDLHSKAEWTPYEGFEAVFPRIVFIRGVKALEDGEMLINKGFGSIAVKCAR
jgi:dihydroorotase